MAYKVIKSTNHTDWLQSRKGGIGSSEVATLLGISPWDTPYKLWLRKTGRIHEEEQETFLMKAGHYLEDAISKFCADETGLEIIKASSAEFVVVNKDKPYLRVSPDRFAWPHGASHSPSNRVIIECKSTQKDIDPENIPPHWFVQIMYQLGVCELETAANAWLTQGRSFGYKWITFDADFYKDVIEAEVERFWSDNVLGDKEPALSDISDVLLKYPKQEVGKILNASDELLDKYNELKETNAEIKRLNAIKDAAEEYIKMTMRDAESVVLPATEETPSRTLFTWKATKASEKFDVAAFKSENGELYAKYLRQQEGSRRFAIK